MKVETTSIPGVLLFEPRVHRDDRGFFTETFHADRYREAGLAYDFIQDNHSRSTRGTLRGLHAQLEKPQGKLVRCPIGEIWDVAVDMRPGSATFGQWVGYTLSEENFRQLWIPPGFAHGFCVLSEIAHVEYKCTDGYNHGDELGLLWNDPQIGIQWPVEEPLLSPKDAGGRPLEEQMARLEAFRVFAP